MSHEVDDDGDDGDDDGDDSDEGDDDDDDDANSFAAPDRPTNLDHAACRFWL